jgi:O-acetylserine/cysteine efflux transporter
MKPHLSWRDAVLALAIVFVWGTNFVVIRLGLDALPPLFFATLRFLFVVLPAYFSCPGPKLLGATWPYTASASDCFSSACCSLP